MHQESLENAPELERELLEGQRFRLLSELLTEPKEKRTLALPSRKLHGLLEVPLGDLRHEVLVIIHIHSCALKMIIVEFSSNKTHPRNYKQTLSECLVLYVNLLTNQFPSTNMFHFKMPFVLRERLLKRDKVVEKDFCHTR